jgi:1-acyl-sn-glycerol-3-phosphate acyltransferase
MHKNNTSVIALKLKLIAPIFGIKLIVRSVNSQSETPKVIIANHQNTFDVITISAAIHRNTVSVGKKSIIWIPFFGLLYWLSGNILIDRKNKNSAKNTINQVVDRIKKNQLSIWMFPEGTRSNGKGLLPFKMGAFHTALKANVPIVPIVLSTTTGFKLNRLNNGYAIVESMPAIATQNYHLDEIKQLADKCHKLMSDKIQALDSEINQLNRK